MRRGEEMDCWAKQLFFMSFVLAFSFLTPLASAEDRGSNGAFLIASPAVAQEQEVTEVVPTEAQSDVAERERILSSDILVITINPHTNLSTTLQVDRHGNVFISFLGEVPVAGLTADELATKLTVMLGEKYLKDPHVTVVIKREKQREASAMVLGEVKTPGTIPIGEEGMTLMEAIRRTGGFTENAYLEKVDITRDFGSRDRVMTVNLKEVVEGVIKDSIIIEAGDLVNVNRIEKEKQNESSVMILGQVRTPGSVVIGEEGLTFMEAIAKAGGFTENAVLEKVSLTRDFGNRDREMFINTRDIVSGLTADSVYIEAGDLIIVESILNQIVVVGQVNSPRSLVLQPGMTFMRAIGESGGFTSLANLKKVKIKRKANNKVEIIDVNAREIQDGKAEDVVLVPGDLIFIPERVF